MNGRAFTIVALLNALTPAAFAESGIPDGADQAQAFLAGRIAVGSSVSSAQLRMEALGFSCTPSESGFADSEAPGTHLYCDRKLQEGFVVKRWQVAVVHRDGVVTALRTSFGLIGP